MLRCRSLRLTSDCSLAIYLWHTVVWDAISTAIESCGYDQVTVYGLHVVLASVLTLAFARASAPLVEKPAARALMLLFSWAGSQKKSAVVRRGGGRGWLDMVNGLGE